MSEAEFCDKCVADLENKILELGPDHVACFIAEPIMASGGVILPPTGYQRRTLEVCRKYGVLLALDEVGFRARFRKSPVRRAGRAGLLRNVAVAMGNSGHAGFVPDLLVALGDDEPLLRGHAAWALGRICPQGDRGEISSRLRYHAELEAHAEVRIELDAAIAQLTDSEET